MTSADDRKKAPVLTPDEKALKAQRGRSIAIALALGALVVIFYALTVVKMGPAIFGRAL